MTDLGKLIEMMNYKRRAGSASESEFIRRFIDPLPGMCVDHYGNRFVDIGKSEVLWSCHTDSVHHGDGMQGLHYDEETGLLKLSRKSRKGRSCKKGLKGWHYFRNNVLGADDAAGVWLMLEMIDAGIPGRYVFHREEECGGGGSQFISKKGDLLKGIKYAIAFDRRGTDSVVTHQFGRCASNAFAWSMAEEINRHESDLKHKPDSGGIFTDTANYDEQVPECSNISVGYEGAHSSAEVLFVPYLIMLRDAMCQFDESKLVCERKPLPRNWWKRRNGAVVDYGGKGKQVIISDPFGGYDDWGYPREAFAHSTERKLLSPPDDEEEPGPEPTPEYVSAVHDFPEVAAKFLSDYGYQLSSRFAKDNPYVVAEWLMEEGLRWESFMNRALGNDILDIPF